MLHELCGTVFKQVWQVQAYLFQSIGWLASFPGSPPAWRRRTVSRGRAWYPFAHYAWHVDVTAKMNYSVTSQLDFCGSNRLIERRLYRWRHSEGSYRIIQAARDTGTVQYKLQNATYLFLTLRWQKFVPRTGERHLLHSLVFLFASTDQDFKLSNTQSNWTDSLHVSDV